MIGLVVITVLVWLLLNLPKKAAPPARKPEPVPGVEELGGKAGLTELDPFFSAAMRSVARRYSFESITVATNDGLPVISTRPDPYEEAARYSTIPARGEESGGREVLRFSMNYRGIPLIGIVRAAKEPPANWMANIEDDVKIILNLWI